MKSIGGALLLSLISLAGTAQAGKENNTLLWKITGKGIDKPSYLFGTIHLICAEDAVLSPNLLKAIRETNEVYFEVDLDNIFEMIGVATKMKMLGDTTLKDLLSKKDYEKVKKFFEENETPLPFSVIETYKPIMAVSLLEPGSMACDNTAMLEQVIMEEAQKGNKKIKGLETMAYQASVLDNIPYKYQAEQLVEYIDNSLSGNKIDSVMTEMFRAYKNQDLKKLEALLINSDAGIAEFTDIMLYHRNQNWIEKLKDILPNKSILIAVGAGHLPGEKGVINLLRKEGYKVTPVNNTIDKSI